MRKIMIGAVLAMAFAMVSLTLCGQVAAAADGPLKAARQGSARRMKRSPPSDVAPGAVDFIETVLASALSFAREEILVGPEVEDAITEVIVDEGTLVKKATCRPPGGRYARTPGRPERRRLARSAPPSPRQGTIVQAEARSWKAAFARPRQPLRGAGT